MRFGIELSGIMLALIFATSVTVFDVKAQSVRTQNSSSSKSASILNAAKQSVGKQMWKGYGLSDGALGCAASLSSVLKVAGVKYATSVRTKEVRAKLLKGPDHATEYDIRKGATDSIDDARLAAVAQPGDILVAFMDSFPRCSLGPRAHCGIIGANGTVYTNDWNNGIWTHGSIHTYFDSYKYIRVIRLR